MPPWPVPMPRPLAFPGAGQGGRGFARRLPEDLKKLPGPFRAKPRPPLRFAGTIPHPRPSFALRPQAIGGRSAGPRSRQPFVRFWRNSLPCPRRSASRILRQLCFARVARESRPPQGRQGLACPFLAVRLASRRGLEQDIILFESGGPINIRVRRKPKLYFLLVFTFCSRFLWQCLDFDC